MSVRQIILLRHAHAEPPEPGQADEERPLTSDGEREARAAGAWLKSRDVQPSLVLCSPALRTRQTADHVLEQLDNVAAPRHDIRIYEATPGALIEILDEHAQADSVLLIGHNPGLETLVSLLTDGTSDNGRGMPPASIAWLDIDEDAELEPGVATLRHFWWP